MTSVLEFEVFTHNVICLKEAVVLPSIIGFAKGKLAKPNKSESYRGLPYIFEFYVRAVFSKSAQNLKGKKIFI